MVSVRITVCMALLNCLCALSTSAFIEPSLRQLDFFLEIFNGDITYILTSCIFIKPHAAYSREAESDKGAADYGEPASDKGEGTAVYREPASDKGE